tara:strand:+ start:124 stop:1011 length:888 start_codon:yes stop_codon:yes gene_type:complete
MSWGIGSDDSDDEWVDSVGVESTEPQTNTNAPIEPIARDPLASDILSLTNIENLPISVEMVNTEYKQNGMTIFRCEPAAGNFPGVAIPSQMRHYKFLHVSIHLLNATVPKNMRLPDPKKKADIFCRCINGNNQERGVFIKSTEKIYFKKKCVNKHTGKDTAFQLGKGFKSNTGGIDPQFCIVITPWFGNDFILDQAVRTDRFYVFSKRQDRFLKAKTKRPRKNAEIERLDTNISAAESTLRELQVELMRLRHQNASTEDMFNRIREKSKMMPESATKIALTFSTRPLNQEEIVDL